ncbi:MAG: hypothetical protein JSV53_12455, partial [candidate division WOR-3 bacterium]
MNGHNFFLRALVVATASIFIFDATSQANTLESRSNQFRQLEVLEDEQQLPEDLKVESAPLRLDSVGLDSIIQSEMEIRHIPGVATCA